MKINAILTSFVGILARLAMTLFLIIMCFKLTVAAYNFGYRVFSEPPISKSNGVSITVDIPTGSSAYNIGKILKNRGLIRDEKLFYIQERLSAYHGKLLPGKYTFQTTMTADDMMKIMAGEGEIAADSAKEGNSESSPESEGDSKTEAAAEEVVESSGGNAGNEAVQIMGDSGDESVPAEGEEYSGEEAGTGEESGTGGEEEGGGY
ncbi:MAG: endolytic transglycosylase MltG [Lachnospiraceae bacterium]|nr:endolytic transglycosylase MltG [Lachnospiraceae bacterium]